MDEHLTNRETNRRIAEFLGWSNLQWRDAGTDGITSWPAGWYGDSPVGKGYLAADYTRYVDDLIPVTEKLRQDDVYLEVAVTGRKSYAADLYDKRDKLLSTGQANTMAMAICHAVMTYLEEH